MRESEPIGEQFHKEFKESKTSKTLSPFKKVLRKNTDASIHQ